MLQNVYLLAKIGADTAENEQDFAEILPIGRRVPDHAEAASRCSLARVLGRRHWDQASAHQVAAGEGLSLIHI